jgi:hypothetical protein
MGGEKGWWLKTGRLVAGGRTGWRMEGGEATGCSTDRLEAEGRTGWYFKEGHAGDYGS